MARFFTKEDYLKVFTQGPWIAMGHYLTVSTWRPNVCPSSANINSTLVRVRFPQVPIKYFNKEVFMRMVD